MKYLPVLKYLPVIAAVLALAGPAGAQTVQDRLNDYPTTARADYVFGCMASNGQTRAILGQCACSIDIIASILPYEKYIEAETVLSLRQTGGERMTVFRTAPAAKLIVSELRRAQAEAEIRCF